MTVTPATTGGIDALERAAQERAGAHEDWAEFVGRRLCRFTIRAQREPSFQVGAQVRSSGDFLVGRFTTVAGRAQLERRVREIGIDGQDRYAVYLPVHGAHELSQARRDAHCVPNTMTLVTMSEPFVHTKLGDNDTIYFFMPRAFVDQRIVSGEDACARTIEAWQGVQRLARDTIAALQREAASMSGEEFLISTRAAGELLLLALAGANDLQSDASSVRASNLARVKRLIRGRLGDPDLALANIARECGLSLRYLHDLFRDDARTASEFILSERLQQARRLIETEPARAGLITDVSMKCGFSSPSHFATAFRRAFGLSPRDVTRRPPR